MFQHAGGSVPITALAFAGPWLLCGESGTLKVFDATTGALITALDIFGATSIHGLACHVTEVDHIANEVKPYPHATGSEIIHPIGNGVKPTSHIVLLWAGPLVSLVEIADRAGAVRVTTLVAVTECPDWVLNGQLRRTSSGLVRAALITAHNALLLLDPQTNRADSALTVATAQSRCILYSAAVNWESDDSILIASGTVFGQIIIWTAHLSGAQASTTLHKIFTGHEGSPFGLYIDTRPRAGESKVPRFVASCSDDRTVRLWDISDLTSIAVDPYAAIDHAAWINGGDEHTGYTGSTSTLKQSESGCFARAMGHLSRIWGVIAFYSGVPDNVRLATFGEDATCHLWALQASESLIDAASSLKLERVIDGHAGKHIWSHALTQQADGTVRIATGGADGAIAIHALTDPVSTPSTSMDALVPGMTRLRTAARADKIRSYAFVTDSDILITTNRGDIFQCRLGQGTTAIFDDLQSTHAQSLVGSEADLAGFCMACSVPNLSIAFLAGKSGSVHAYSPMRGLSRLLVGERKAAAIEAKQLDSHTALCLISWLNDSTVGLLRVDVHSLEHELVSVQLPDSEVVTSFCILGTQAGLIAVGCRSGNVAYYRIKRGDEQATSPAPVLVRRQHVDAVTDLHELSNDGDNLLVISTCRDGSYSVSTLSTTEGAPISKTVHHLALPALTEAHCIHRLNNDIVIAGFHRKHFVSYSVLNETTLSSTDIGGSNRQWMYQPSVLAWTQASALHVAPAIMRTPLRINAGLHGREMKVMALHPNKQFLATGAEDTDIKLHRLSTSPDGTVKLTCLRTLRRHNTGIQALQWSPDGQRLISTGGMEELLVWHITEVADFGLGVVCESICPFKDEEPDLRITDVDLREANDGLTMAISRSDSSVETYDYIYDPTPTWCRRAEGKYLTCALTNLTFTPTGVIAVATDGHAVLLDDKLTWTKRVKLHQSAVQCLDTVQLADDDILLASGGDDNALSLSRVPGSGGPTQKTTLTVRRAHAAAVTGIRVLAHDARRGLVWLVTAGLDQRVVVWEVAVDAAVPGADGMAVRRIGRVDAAVADVGDVAAWADANGLWVMVCGVGWDAWRVQL